MRFIVALILVLLVPISKAEVPPFELQLPITCGDTNNFLDGLKERYNEEVVMMSSSKNDNGEQLYHSLWINMGDQTWSFIVVNKERGVTCLLASGSNFKMFFPKINGI